MPNYCTEHYTALMRLLTAAEDMRATTRSRVELHAYEQAAKRIRSKLVEHMEFCGSELDRIKDGKERAWTQ